MVNMYFSYVYCMLLDFKKGVTTVEEWKLKSWKVEQKGKNKRLRNKF